MACGTQLGELSHSKDARARGQGNAWGSSVGTILQERKNRKVNDWSKRQEMPSIRTFSFPSPSSKPSQRTQDSKPSKPSESSQTFKIMMGNEEKKPEKKKKDKADNKTFGMKEGMDFLEQLGNDKSVESSGDIPGDIPDGSKIITTATLIMDHQIIFPDGTTKSYSEKYVSTNEDQH